MLHASQNSSGDWRQYTQQSYQCFLPGTFKFLTAKQSCYKSTSNVMKGQRTEHVVPHILRFVPTKASCPFAGMMTLHSNAHGAMGKAWHQRNSHVKSPKVFKALGIVGRFEIPFCQRTAVLHGDFHYLRTQVCFCIIENTYYSTGNK